MDPRSCYVSCFGTTLPSSPPFLDVGFYENGFHTRSCGLCRLGQDVPKRENELKDFNSNLNNVRGLA